MANGCTSHLQSSDAQGQFNAAVDELLDQLQHKFDNVSREMFGKCEFTTSYHILDLWGYELELPANPLCFCFAVDDMARRLDELEASLAVSDDNTVTPAPSK